MKIVQIKQNTPEWLEWRLGKSGGSEFDGLWISGLPTKAEIIEFLEKDGQKLSPADKRESVETLAAMLTPLELAQIKIKKERKMRYYEIIAEAVARPITPNDYADRLNGEPFSMMARGHILEKEAIAMFAERMKNEADFSIDANPYPWESDWNPDIYVSPDGAISDKNGKIWGAIEVKCPESKYVIKTWKKQEWPREYEAQVVKYFVINEDLQKLFFLIYTDVIPGLDLQVFEIKREDVADKIEDARIFEDEIMKLAAQDIAKITEMGF